MTLSAQHRWVIVETDPGPRPGSMTAYAELLESALLCAIQNRQSIKIERVNLGENLPKWFEKCGRWGYRLRVLALMSRAKRILPRLNADLIHLVDGSHAYVLNGLNLSKVVVTSHDLIPLLQLKDKLPGPQTGRFARWLINKAILGLHGADQVVAVSSSTACDLIKEGMIEENKVSVVLNALQSVYLQHETGAPKKWQPGRSYILHVGNNGFYKNRSGVMRIFAKVVRKADVRLIMAGSEPDASLRQLRADLTLGDSVDFVIDPTAEELVELYRGAALFLFPSLYEGFGWPPLEAMACGCPVVCSNVASLPEVVADAALTCDPDNEEEMAKLCVSVLENVDVAESLISKGFERAKQFTPERMGQEILEVYEKVLDSDFLPVTSHQSRITSH